MLIKIAIRCLRVVPDWLGSVILRNLAKRTKPAPVSDLERAAMAQATRSDCGGRTVWTWGEGPLVIFIHGWACRAAQMAPLAQHVAQLGFRSVVFDITGHGESQSRQTQWDCFLNDIAGLTASLGGDVYAYVGHSAGGLTMMAARELKGIRAQRYVCICAPVYPYPLTDAIQGRLAPKKGAMARYQAHIAHQFETTWQKLQTGISYAGASDDLLLVYDKSDRIVSHTDGDKLQSFCPGSRLVKTGAYGHLRVLGAPELADAVGDFLTWRVTHSGNPQHLPL